MSDRISNSRGFSDEQPAQDDLRRRVSATLLTHADAIAADAVAIFPFGGGDGVSQSHCQRIGRLLAQTLGCTVRDGRLDSRSELTSELHRVALECSPTMETIFGFAYLTERMALDELALDQAIGATTESWPLVAQLVRRASFDLLAAYAERAQLEPSGAGITDRLTTLYTRAVFDAALVKVCDRAGRFGDPMSIILFDVDRLSIINSTHGYGVGDRLLERMGILVRGFFRQHDWIARYSEDAMAVILSRTDAEDAAVLAERVRETVKERLEFLDHRTEQPVRVTISAGVVNVSVTQGHTLDTERVMADAEAALGRAKQQGGNRVERIESYSRSS